MKLNLVTTTSHVGLLRLNDRLGVLGKDLSSEEIPPQPAMASESEEAQKVKMLGGLSGKVAERQLELRRLVCLG